MSDYNSLKKAPVFRGATKQAMIFGVPLIPLVAFCTPVLALSMFVYQFIGGIYAMMTLVSMIFIVIFMREQTKIDDQRLNFFLANLREKGWLTKNKGDSSIYYIPPTPLKNKNFIRRIN